MATRYLKDLEGRKRVCLELTSELRGWRYLLNEEGALAMQKPDAQNLPVLRSQAYVNATAKTIADFLAHDSNNPSWDPCCSVCETDEEQPKGGVTLILRHARYSLGSEPELQRVASYAWLRANYERGICFIGFSVPQTEPTEDLPIEFLQFSFILEAQGQPTEPCTKVTFLWQAKFEGNLNTERRTALFRTVGECTGRLKSAVESHLSK